MCSFFERASAIKGLSELSYDWKCLFSPVWQNFGENMTFVSFHSGHVVMMLFLKLQILCKAGYCSTFVCVSKAYHLSFFLLQLFGYIGYKDTRSSIQKLINFRYQKTKWPIELWTLQQEMETDDDCATMRESFSLVLNILFVEYTDIYFLLICKNMVEKQWKAVVQFGLVLW